MNLVPPQMIVSTEIARLLIARLLTAEKIIVNPGIIDSPAYQYIKLFWTSNAQWSLMSINEQSKPPEQIRRLAA
jgi:hypothetical protein